MHSALSCSLPLVAVVAALSLQSCSSTAPAAENLVEAEPSIRPGMTVLFQGDSITDAGRNKKNQDANNHGALGRGYASLAAADLMVHSAPEQLSIYNRGISGNKVFQLADRWEADCLELEPDLVSVLIGVNDIWHTKNGRYEGTVEIYERDYDALLARTVEALPEVQLVVCEPFVLRCGAVKDDWFPEFDEYRAAAKRVAEKHGAIFVPFQSMFDDALAQQPAEYWAKDGVHPSRAGAALMAKTWLQSVRGD